MSSLGCHTRPCDASTFCVRVCSCCQVSYRLHQATGAAYCSHLRADLGPLPRYGTAVEYDAHLARARVVHVTALSQPWRKRDSRVHGIMHKVSQLVLARVNASWDVMSAQHKQCLQTTAQQMAIKHPPVLHTAGSRARDPFAAASTAVSRAEGGDMAATGPSKRSRKAHVARPVSGSKRRSASRRMMRDAVKLKGATAPGELESS